MRHTIHYTCLNLILAAALPLAAQTAAAIKGDVTDPSGAVVPGAVVTLRGPQNFSHTIQTNETGAFVFEGLIAGRYTARITASGFTPFEVRNLKVDAGRAVSLRSELKIATETQSVTVEDMATVSVEPDSTASAIILKGEDLDVLSDNPDDLASDLQALAGPSAGPNGGEILIDGFSGGKLPPKSSIREVRINQNPFSAEYDRLGFGRIEIFTKPGSGKPRGNAFFSFGNQSLNSRNPFAANKAPYLSQQYGVDFGGPLSKKSSYFVDIERRAVDENAIINATVLDSSLLASPFSQAVVTPMTRLSVSPRVDYQLNPNNTLIFRYHLSRADSEGQGIGQFTMPSRATNTEDREHLFQLTETAVLGARAVNETRFQYGRTRLNQMGDNSQAALNVLESFNSGGALIGQSGSKEDRYEIQNYTSLNMGRHLVKFGGRLRTDDTTDLSDQNFNGTFTFAGGLAPQLDAANQVIAGSNGNPLLAEITSLARYRRTLLFQDLGYAPAQIRALGGGASQFTMTTGNPAASVLQTDAGLFAEDSWRVRPNFTLNYGLRYETQSNIKDYTNFAPRLSIAWGLDGKNGGQTKTVLRTGVGMFYDRVPSSLTLQARRFDGATQAQYFVTNPNFFPEIPSASGLAGFKLPPTVRMLADGGRAPYIMQAVAGIDRQLPWNTTVSTSFVFSRGVHMLRTRNINAPLADGTLPIPGAGNLYQFETSGFMTQKQLLVNARTRFSRRVSMFGFYVYGQANSDTDGTGSFPVNQSDVAAEWGRATYDVRHHFLMGGSLQTLWGVSLNPFISGSSGAPFNITTGRDANGDTIFNDRPSFAQAGMSGPNIVATQFGIFNLTPLAGDTLIPRNYGDGPGQFAINLRLSKTWGFGSRGGSENARNGEMPPPGMMGMGGGPGGGGPPGGGRGGPGGGGPGGMRGGMFDGSSDHRFNVTFSVSARNVLNHTNLGTPIGNLSSPMFGDSNSLGGFGGPGGRGGPGGPGGMTAGGAGNRRIELMLRFSF